MYKTNAIARSTLNCPANMATSGSGRGYLYACVITADLLAFSVGIMETWSSPILPKLNSTGDDNPLESPVDSTESSWIGSLLSLGAIFGPPLFSLTAEKFGRKWTLLSFALLSILSFLLFAFANDILMIYVGRVISGLVTGGLFTIVPAYVAEISENEIRGAVSATINLFLVVGLLFTYALGPYVSIMWFNLISVIPTALFVCLFLKFTPETPRWLIKNAREADAQLTLKALRSSDDVGDEFEETKAVLAECKSGGLGDLFGSRGNLKVLGMCVGLVVFQQFSGIMIILTYTENIFKESGTSLSSDVSAIIIGVIQVIAGVITPLVVDRYGRRVLLLVSGVGMLISEGALALYFTLENREGINWLPILCLVVYMITYGCGFGPLPWTIMAEILPSEIKAVAAPMTASICWTFSFILTFFYQSMQDGLGNAGPFWLFSAFNLLSILFTLFILPETKGKSPKEIQEMFQD